MPEIKNILVTGVNGQLGSEFRKLSGFYPQYRFLFTSREELSIGNETAIENFFSAQDIDCCINCAAYTAVDKAESERDAAYAANAAGPGYLAAVCRRKEVKLIHFSTDYVFSGSAHHPYTEEDITGPVNYYGETKLAGEKLVAQNDPAAIIIRTSWVYSSFGKNFVKTMMRLMAEKQSINVVNDQTGAPTYAADLASGVMEIITKNNFIPGIYHYSNEGIISWYDFAIAIKEITGSTCMVNGIPSAQYPTPAKRSAYSAMNTAKIKNTFLISIPAWKNSLRKCIAILSAGE